MPESLKKVLKMRVASVALGASVAMLADSSLSIAASVDPLYCEENRVAAEQAANAAIANSHELNGVVSGTLVGTGCGMLLLLAAVDGGISTIICTIATAGAVYATSTPRNSAEIAQNAWRDVRDPRCIN